MVHVLVHVLVQDLVQNLVQVLSQSCLSLAPVLPHFYTAIDYFPAAAAPLKIKQFLKGYYDRMINQECIDNLLWIKNSCSFHSPQPLLLSARSKETFIIAAIRASFKAALLLGIEELEKKIHIRHPKRLPGGGGPTKSHNEKQGNGKRANEIV